MSKSNLITFIGPPSSGKSTLAQGVNHQLKVLGKNSIFAGEAATEYIAEFGIPTTHMDQLVIFYKQIEREKMYIGKKDWIVCDCSSILNYFYFRNLFPSDLSKKDIACINQVQKEVLTSIGQWEKIYYVPPIHIKDTLDGIRYHDTQEIKRSDNIIRNYLEMERIDYIDLSNIPLESRCEYVIKDMFRDQSSGL